MVITADNVFNDVSKIVDELGVEIVTMKLLRKRLEAQYGCSLDEHKELLEQAVEKKFRDPKTQLAVQRAAQNEPSGAVSRGRKKKRSRREAEETPAKVKGPKRPQSAYFFYIAKNRKAISEKFPGISVAQISVKAGEGWKGLTEDEKKPYIELAENDKKRYEAEMKDHVKNGGEIPRGARKAKKDIGGPLPPKRPQSAFFLYLNSRRESFQKSQPTKLSITEVTKKLSQEWKELSDEQKVPYQQKEAELKKLYEKELEVFRKEHPNASKPRVAPQDKKRQKVDKKFLVEDDEVSERSSSTGSSSSSSSSDTSSDSNKSSTLNSDSDSDSSESSSE